MAAIKMVSVSKSFGVVPVLQELNLTVQWGECLVALGPNGAGKTVMLKILSTQSQPDGGDVWVGGVERREDSGAIRSMVGVVGHQNLLYGDLTGYENLKFFGRMYGVNGLEERIDHVLGLVKMKGYAHERINILSHGMQKRIALARAVIHDPPILLLDEPESGLDIESLGVLRNTLMSGSTGRRSVVMTTHNMEYGLSMGDRIAILYGGKIVFQGNCNGVNESIVREKYKGYLDTGQ